MSEGCCATMEKDLPDSPQGIAAEKRILAWSGGLLMKTIVCT